MNTINEEDRKKILAYAEACSTDGKRNAGVLDGAEFGYHLRDAEVERLNEELSKAKAWKDTMDSLNVIKELDGMMKSSKDLYEKILDTPGFSFHFNNICNLAQRKNEEVERLRKENEEFFNEIEYCKGKHYNISIEKEKLKQQLDTLKKQVKELKKLMYSVFVEMRASCNVLETEYGVKTPRTTQKVIDDLHTYITDKQI